MAPTVLSGAGALPGKIWVLTTPRRGVAAWHTQLAAVVLAEKVPVDLARKR
jgi:hypothetical protein